MFSPAPSGLRLSPHFVPGLEVARWGNRSLSFLLSFIAFGTPQEAQVAITGPRSQTGGWRDLEEPRGAPRRPEMPEQRLSHLAPSDPSCSLPAVPPEMTTQ